MLLRYRNSRGSFIIGLVLAALHMMFFAFELLSGKFSKHHTAIIQPANITPNSDFSGEKDKDWNNIFSFVPPGIKSCSDLFNSEHRSKPFGPKFVYKSKFFREKLGLHYSPVKYKDANSWQFVEQAKVLHELGVQEHVETICETGFNAGHSAYAWLVTNPNVTVYSFDIGNYKYSKPLASILERHFENRFKIVWGDSSITLPVFRDTHPDISCDIIFIDGGRTYSVIKSDFSNFLRMANIHSVIILNNYPSTKVNNKIGRVWERAKRSGHITEIFHCDYEPEFEHGFTVGRVNF